MLPKHLDRWTLVQSVPWGTPDKLPQFRFLLGCMWFSPFQIITQHFIFFTKWMSAAILYDRKSLLIGFLAISYQYATFFLILFSKWPPVAILDAQFLPKSIGTSIYSRSVATSNMTLIGVFLIKFWSTQAFSSHFHKMATGGHFGFPDSLQNQ